VGLGLSISRELVAVMKGRLWADFDEAGDLRVHLLLPAARDAQKKTEPAPAEEKALAS
jgi:signal transduction histidine kinase